MTHHIKLRLKEAIEFYSYNRLLNDYERQMKVSTGLLRFVSVCTSLFCNRIIVEDSMDLYRYGGNTGTKTGTLFHWFWEKGKMPNYETQIYLSKIKVMEHIATIKWGV